MICAFVECPSRTETTLINVLTGIYGPTGGRAYVQGKSIFSYETSVLSGIGVCPQFDRLWDELSPRQHLHLYGSIRGLTGRDLKLAVQDAIDKFDLREHADKRSKQLSGGNKRKLSVSMAFIGNPKVRPLKECSSLFSLASPLAPVVVWWNECPRVHVLWWGNGGRTMLTHFFQPFLFLYIYILSYTNLCGLRW